MGFHYVPQKYLKGFAETGNPDKIWMYDKKIRQFSNPAIKSIAQESGFYDNDVEQQLNEFVEKPANKVLDKLRNQEKITDTDRIHLGIYIATMIIRVPKHRTDASAMVPKVAEKASTKIRTQIKEWEQSSQDKEFFERMLLKLEVAEESLQNNIPDYIKERIREPWPSEEMEIAVCTMSWRIARSPESYFFITSDNPVYYFNHGIGTPKSKLIFPISTDLALFACWQGEPITTDYIQATPIHVREANKRLMSGAERFVFSHRKEDWIA